MAQTDGVTTNTIQESSSMLIGSGYDLYEGALQDYGNIPGLNKLQISNQNILQRRNRR